MATHTELSEKLSLIKATCDNLIITKYKDSRLRLDTMLYGVLLCNQDTNEKKYIINKNWDRIVDSILRNSPNDCCWDIFAMPFIPNEGVEVQYYDTFVKDDIPEVISNFMINHSNTIMANGEKTRHEGLYCDTSMYEL